MIPPKRDRDEKAGWKLLALPIGRPLVEEGVHPLAEILAQVSLEDQVLALVARQGTADASYRFLGDLEGDRCVAGDELCGLFGTALQYRDVGHDLVE